MKTFFSILLLVAWSNAARASLSVKMDEPKITGSKAVIKLTMENTYKEAVKSARAVVFLRNEKGKVIGQKAEWVIGGTKSKPALEPKHTATYFMTVPADKPFEKADILFIRIVLEGGKVIQAGKGFQLQK